MKFAGIGVLAVAVLALGGCKSLGLTDESTKDWSAETTKAGSYIKLDAPQKVKVVEFKTDFAANPAQVVVTLKNEGDSYAFFSVDVEFGFPAPPGSFAPYDPDFQSIDLEDFKKGGSQTVTVAASPGQVGAPYFARISPITGSDVRVTTGRENSVRGLRAGTKLLNGRVEVVKVEGDLTSEKPSLAYTLENVDAKGAEIGKLKYMVQFYKDGKLMKLPRKFSFFRPAGKPLGKKGETMVVAIAGLEAVSGIAGAKPVLRVKQ
jgi:hypothetical protein